MDEAWNHCHLTRVCTAGVCRKSSRMRCMIQYAMQCGPGLKSKCVRQRESWARERPKCCVGKTTTLDQHNDRMEKEAEVLRWFKKTMQ
ncbi:hypothetical protein NDU88_012366 [Pleurodeles waltl]|uniref:Uncharacterized protein n=1 Tax=Pleurodeles waltl TaxID=8319 RepID=A0AAV7QZY6_PLEWA|nr:hypothetical protein NDU88_012366 [Pleurodeles waltl]